MKFDFICDNMPDGLVLMDEAYFKEFNEDLLYSFEIWLDQEGRTELRYDFPEEDWGIIWERESALIKDFCNEGKMFVFLWDKDAKDCKVEFADSGCESEVHMNLPSGKLIVVNAGELIQCLAYPDLEMEKILELDVEAGTYAVECEGIERIRLSRVY